MKKLFIYYYLLLSLIFITFFLIISKCVNFNIYIKNIFTPTKIYNW